MQYLGFLHSCIQSQPWANSVLIRVQWEDISEAEKRGYNWKAIPYGFFSNRKKERGLIYPNKETYSEWASISRQYSNVFLSINFDIYPADKRQKFINFVTEVVNFFYLYNKNLIVGAGNETFEKRGTANKVLEVVCDVATGVYRTQKSLPICFWNEKIRTTNEKTAAEILIKNSTIPQMCKYFGYQSLATTPETSKKYIQLAQSKGLKVLDVEVATTTEPFSEIKELVDNGISNGVEGFWIMAPVIDGELYDSEEYKIWRDYTLSVDYEEGGFIKDKYKIINYAKKFLEKEEITDMKLEKYYYRDRPERLIKYDKEGYGIRFLRACFGLSDSNIFDYSLIVEVEKYQAVHNLLVDGKVGPETFGNIMEFADYSKHYCWVHSLWARDM